MNPGVQFWLVSVCILAQAMMAASAPAEAVTAVDANSREVRSLDTDWRFHLGDTAGAERADHDDSAWRRLDVPHDWSIEGQFDREHPAGPAGGFLPAGVGWYRKVFSLPPDASGKLIAIEFDGVMANSDVWINGHHLGHRPFGYVSFRYDLTDQVKFGDGGKNVIAVRVDNSQQPASRWYTGAGIYRRVRLVITDRLHIAPSGVFVSIAGTDDDHAVVEVQTTVTNASERSRDIALCTELHDPTGNLSQTERTTATLASQSSHEFRQRLSVNNPQRWSLERPDLYRAESRLHDGDDVVDHVSTSFGIREAEFRSETGFWLNGRNLKIKGVCLHHDGGAVGAAVPSRVWERRLRTLRGLGVNAIRTAHNPPSPELLDLCDRLGLLVMEEFFDCWRRGKVPHDYHRHFDEWANTDLRDTIRRDRNHPSVILYSVGNEIRDMRDEASAKRILGQLLDVCRENDPTRPVTQALFRPNRTGDYDNGLADMLDVVGTNYRDGELLAAWRAKPTRRIIGTEQGHEARVWLACRDNPQHAGQFLWVGIDYFGESPRWPITTFNAGLLDRTGQPYPRAFQRQSWWSDEPMVAIMRRVGDTEPTPVDPGYEQAEWRRRTALLSDWTPSDLQPHAELVEVYSNCEEVELLLNGVTLGKKPLPTDGSPRVWRVEFEPGSLVATGLNDGKVAATNELRTAGKLADIVLITDATSLCLIPDDVAFVEALCVDDNGIRVPRSDPVVEFSITGPGEIIAVDNGSIVSHEPFRATRRRAEEGRCVAIVRATGHSGNIVVSARTSNLTSNLVRIAIAEHNH